MATPWRPRLEVLVAMLTLTVVPSVPIAPPRAAAQSFIRLYTNSPGGDTLSQIRDKEERVRLFGVESFSSM